MAFDFAILATGISYPIFHADPEAVGATKAQRVAEYDATRAKVEAASSVAVVGGGAVGVELAAMIKDVHPDKAVTLLAGNGGILERMDPKAREFAAKWFADKGVEVVTGERVAEWSGLASATMAANVKLVTDKGTTVEADLGFKCVGFKAVSGWVGGSGHGVGCFDAHAHTHNPTPPQATYMFDSELKTKLTAAGFIAAEPTLQLAGWPNVLAAGDCIAVREEKTANLADLSGMVAARNVLALAAGKPLSTYPDGLFGLKDGAAVPFAGGAILGRSAGVFQVGDDVQSGSMPVKFKGIIATLYRRAVGGSWFFNWLLYKLKGMVIGQVRCTAEQYISRPGHPATGHPSPAHPAACSCQAPPRASRRSWRRLPPAPLPRRRDHPLDTIG